MQSHKASLVNEADPIMRQTLVRSPGSGRSSGEGNGNPLQYPCVENPMDGVMWQATVHGVAKRRTRLIVSRQFCQLCEKYATAVVQFRSFVLKLSEWNKVSITMSFSSFAQYDVTLPMFLMLRCCSAAKSVPTLCDPVDCSMPGFPVLHYLLEFAQIHVH